MTREEAMEILNNTAFFGRSQDDIDNAIDMAVEALKQEPRKGHWINYDCDEDKYDKIKCSECGHIFIVDSYHWCDIGFTKDDLKYCPNCGTKMVEEPTISLEAYKQVTKERDIAIEQLHELGYEFGEKIPTTQERQAESDKLDAAFHDGYNNGYAQARFDYEQESTTNNNDLTEH